MSAITEGRAAAEARMQDTFTAYSPNGTTVVGGLEVPAFKLEPFTATSAGTPGKVQGSSAATTDPATDFVLVGGVRRPVMRAGLHIPISAPVPVAGDQGVGWEYECAAVGSLSDPSLVGRRFLVVNVPAKSFATARRLDVVEV